MSDKVRMPNGRTYEPPMRRGNEYRPPRLIIDEIGPLVSQEERTEKLAAEMLGLSPDSQTNLKNLIRLYRHMEQAIDKRRLLSDPVMGSGDPQPPGDKLMADLLIEANRALERLNRRRRKQKDSLNDEVYSLRVKFANRMDAIEGFADPDRVKARMAKRAKEAEMASSGTC